MSTEAATMAGIPASAEATRTFAVSFAARVDKSLTMEKNNNGRAVILQRASIQGGR